MEKLLELLCINCYGPVDVDAGQAYFFPEDEESDGPLAVCSDCVKRHKWESDVVRMPISASHQDPGSMLP